MNAFEVLGLTADANEQQIRRAYHARVKRCHPDQFTDAEMQRKAQEELTELNGNNITFDKKEPFAQKIKRFFLFDRLDRGPGGSVRIAHDEYLMGIQYASPPILGILRPRSLI